MVGPLIKAGNISKKYPGKAKRKNGRIVLKNSDGKFREVPASATVYHRGNGKFARYETERDRKIKAPVNHSDKKNVGSGNYRHAGDGKRIVERGSRKKKR